MLSSEGTSRLPAEAWAQVDVSQVSLGAFWEKKTQLSQKLEK